LAELERVVPCARLVKRSQPLYPKGERGRPPIRHWLERHDLTKALFEEVGVVLEERGLLMRQGTIVDATIIAAPPSTKNRSKSRDPEMHQTRKGNQWHFGMKAHIGVDAHRG
jgi:transposase, IS5 family